MDDPSRDATVLLSRFSLALGWTEVERHQAVFDPPHPTTLYYTSGIFSCIGKTHFALQINEHPIGAVGTFAAEVRCLPYKLRSGFRAFTCLDVQQAELEAHRLHSWLGHEWFASTKRRREYRKMHPECANFTGVFSLESARKFGHLHDVKSDES